MKNISKLKFKKYFKTIQVTTIMIHPDFQTHGQSSEVRNSGYQWPVKMDLGPKNKKKEIASIHPFLIPVTLAFQLTLSENLFYYQCADMHVKDYELSLKTS